MKKLKLSKEKIEELYSNNKSLNDIAIILKCSVGTVCNYCKKYGINVLSQYESQKKFSIKKRTGKFIKCEECGKIFYITKCRLNRNKHNFCSHKCSTDFKKDIKLSKYHIKKISMNNAKYWLNKKRSKKTIEKIRKATIKQLKNGRMPNKETNIERLFKKSLIKYNIRFEEQKTFDLGIADFYLPDKRTFVFCDGDYWHNYPFGKTRDSKQVRHLKSKGFNAYRFWEHDILKYGDESVVLLYK